MSNINLQHLGLQFQKPNYSLFYHHQYKSETEFLRALRYINEQEIDNLLKKRRDLYGVCLFTQPGSKYIKKVTNGLNKNKRVSAALKLKFRRQIHIAIFTQQKNPFEVCVVGHEETHALGYMGEIPRLEERINNFLQSENFPLTGINNKDEELAANIGGLYALTMAYSLPSSSLVKGVTLLLDSTERYKNYKKQNHSTKNSGCIELINSIFRKMKKCS